MKEIWRSVVGYEGWYEVSNVGRVRRIKPAMGARVGYILSSSLCKGYCGVQLKRTTKYKFKHVHILVAEAFMSPAPKGHQINHKDGVKTNNNVNNLEWVTPQQNSLHYCRGLGKNRFQGQHQGELNNYAKLTNRDIVLIRKLLTLKKLTHREIGGIFGVGPQAIGNIKNKKRWAHVN